MATDATYQQISTGHIDHNQVVISGLTGFLGGEVSRYKSKVTSKSYSKASAYDINETSNVDSSSIVRNSINEQKYIPNPYGKKGSPAHRNVIETVSKDIAGRGYKAKEEYHFNGITNGYKTSRYADVVALKDGNLVEIHQVGRTLKDNVTPVIRERRAIIDIENAPQSNGVHVTYHPYDV